MENRIINLRFNSNYDKRSKKVTEQQNSNSYRLLFILKKSSEKLSSLFSDYPDILRISSKLG